MIFSPRGDRPVAPQRQTVIRAPGDGNHVLPKRWIVERISGWLMRHRRLVRDYESTESSAESMVHLAMIRLTRKRLA